MLVIRVHAQPRGRVLDVQRVRFYENFNQIRYCVLFSCLLSSMCQWWYMYGSQYV